MMKLTGETTAVYGDASVAMRNLPMVAAYMSAVKFRHPEDAEGAAATAEDAIFKILRGTEMRGLAQQPAEIKRALAASLKGQEVFGDQFDPSIAFQAIKYGRLASRYLSDRFLEGPGLIMAQELGGSNFGNSLNMTMNALIGGHITKAALAKLEEVGIIDGKRVKMGPHGTFDMRDAVPEQRLLQSDPDKWFQQHFAPQVDRYSHGNLDKRDQVIRQLFQRGTAQQMAELLGWQTAPGGRITKDVARLGAADTPEQAVDAAMKNLATSTTALGVQFDRFKANLGAPVAHVLGTASQHLTGPWAAANTWLGVHEGAAGAAFAGIGVGVLGLGGVAGKLAWGAAKNAAGAFGAAFRGEEVAKAVKGVAGLSGEAAKVAGVAPKAAKGLAGIGGELGGLLLPLRLLGAVRFLSIAGGLEMLLEAAIKFETFLAGKATLQPGQQPRAGSVEYGHSLSAPRPMITPPPPAAMHLHATIPVHVGGKHVDTLVKHTMARVAERGLFNSTSNSDPRITPGHSGSVPMGSF